MSIILLPESYNVCFVETITLISVLWISISAKFGFGPLCQVALVQRLGSLSRWKLCCSMGRVKASL